MCIDIDSLEYKRARMNNWRGIYMSARDNLRTVGKLQPGELRAELTRTNLITLNRARARLKMWCNEVKSHLDTLPA